MESLVDIEMQAQIRIIALFNWSKIDEWCNS